MVGFCFSFPVEQTAVDSGKIIVWTKGALPLSLVLGHCGRLQRRHLVFTFALSDRLELIVMYRSVRMVLLVMPNFRSPPVPAGFENEGAVGSDPVKLLGDALKRQGLDAEVPPHATP